ncbi:MAG: hypothetical protein ACI4TW_04920 [Prevotella sp.]
MEKKQYIKPAVAVLELDMQALMNVVSGVEGTSSIDTSGYGDGSGSTDVALGKGHEFVWDDMGEED